MQIFLTSLYFTFKLLPISFRLYPKAGSVSFLFSLIFVLGCSAPWAGLLEVNLCSWVFCILLVWRMGVLHLLVKTSSRSWVAWEIWHTMESLLICHWILWSLQAKHSPNPHFHGEDPCHELSHSGLIHMSSWSMRKKAPDWFSSPVFPKICIQLPKPYLWFKRHRCGT